MNSRIDLDILSNKINDLRFAPIYWPALQNIKCSIDLFSLQNKKHQSLLKDEIICCDDVQRIWIIYNFVVQKLSMCISAVHVPLCLQQSSS